MILESRMVPVEQGEANNFSLFFILWSKLDNDADTWRDAKKIFKNNGHKNGKYLLLENYDPNGNTIVHRITLWCLIIGKD